MIAVAGFIATGFSAAIQALSGHQGRRGPPRAHHLRRPGRQPAAAAVGGARRVRRRPVLPAARRPQGRAAVRGPVGGDPRRAAQARARPPPRRRRATRRPAPPGCSSRSRAARASGKTTQARLTAIWLREQGYDVVTTNEPGATKIGMRLRALLLDTAHAGMSPQSEALLYAADRAEHVRQGHRPGPGPRRGRDHRPLHRLLAGLPGRRAGHPDGGHRPAEQLGDRRADARPHRAARHAAGDRARAGTPARPTGSRPSRSSSTAGSGPGSSCWPARSRTATWCSTRPGPSAELTEQIKDKIREILPDPVPRTAEAVTGSFPAIPDHAPGPARDQSRPSRRTGAPAARQLHGGAR